jgi:Damage-control phosphatase ARMT1-like domain
MDSMRRKGDPYPNLPIPPPICSNIPGTWAYETMSRRIDEMLQCTYDENKERFESPEFKTILTRFNDLRAELKSNSKLTMLDDLHRHSIETQEEVNRRYEWHQWEPLLRPLLDQEDTWLSAPFMVAELYVYRKLMQAIGYSFWNTPGYQWDPFATQKQAELVSSVAMAEPMLEKVFALLSASKPSYNPSGIALVASMALWGKQMDLSGWPANMSNANMETFSSILANANETLLHDDTLLLQAHCEVLRHKNNGKGGEVYIIVENAGFELITDLVLAHYLIESGIATMVTFYSKSHPTLVNGATGRDIREHVRYYATQVDPSIYPNTVKAGQVWQSLLDSQKYWPWPDAKWYNYASENFCAQPYAMWDMAYSLRNVMAKCCDLAIVKGDANYRRLLGDRSWEYTAPFQDVVGCYFPSPICALRTLKSEVGCGMDATQTARAAAMDPLWQVNGRFGVIHFGTGQERGQPE